MTHKSTELKTSPDTFGLDCTISLCRHKNFFFRLQNTLVTSMETGPLPKTTRVHRPYCAELSITPVRRT